MASSTTKPTDSVMAIIDSVSIVKPSSFITPNVPSSESGTAKPGISVAETLRRKKKITRITSAMVSSSVNLTSAMDCRIFCDASKITSSEMPAGMFWRSEGSRLLMPSTTATVLVPGCFCTASTMASWSLTRNSDLSVVTLSVTRATSSSRTGLPLR